MRYKGWGNTFPNLGEMVDLGELSQLMSNSVVVLFQVIERAAREVYVFIPLKTQPD